MYCNPPGSIRLGSLAGCCRAWYYDIIDTTFLRRGIAIIYKCYFSCAVKTKVAMTLSIKAHTSIDCSKTICWQFEAIYWRVCLSCISSSLSELWSYYKNACWSAQMCRRNGRRLSCLLPLTDTVKRKWTKGCKNIFNQSTSCCIFLLP